MLSIVNLGFGGKAKPKVGYATAMDVYIIICFFAVFAALVDTFADERAQEHPNLRSLSQVWNSSGLAPPL